MVPVTERWTIVLVGFWNTMIFQPNWIRGRLTEGDEIVLEFPANNPTLLPRIRFEGTILTLSNKQIVLNSETIEDQSLERLQDIALRILQELPHTPQIAAGINFNFVENEPIQQMIEYMEIGDRNILADNGYNIQNTLVKRTLTSDNRILNIEFELNTEGNLRVGFNFHRDCNNTNETIAFIQQNGILQLRDQVINILNDIYQLDVNI